MSTTITNRIQQYFPSDQSLSSEEVFSILSNRRRRYTLHYLLQSDDETTLRDLAEQVAAWESGTTTVDIDSSTRKRVYTALQQNHLPSMDEAGVITFDKHRGTIEPTPALEELDIYLDIVKGHQIPWSQYYLVLSVGGLLLTATVWAIGYPFSIIPPLAWPALISIIFVVTSLTHLYENREHKFGTSDKPPEIE